MRTAEISVTTVNPIAHQTIQEVSTQKVVSGVSMPQTISGWMQNTASRRSASA